MKETLLVSMEISFFALPSQQGPVQGRFKPAHRPISLSTKVAACVRRFETPTPLNYGRTESKKDISMFFSPVSFSGGFTCSILREKNLLSIVSQLVNRFFYVFQCSMGLPFFVNGKGWVPPPDEFFNTAYIDIPVV